MPTACIIGGSRGLGRALVDQLATTHDVYATLRGSIKDLKSAFPQGVRALENVDLELESAAQSLVTGLGDVKLGTIIVSIMGSIAELWDRYDCLRCTEQSS